MTPPNAAPNPPAKPVAYIFTVRERPVGFRPSHFGGELFALERGYFPVSSTGYRSLAGSFGFERNLQASAIPPRFIEQLAEDQDKERQTLLKRLSRTHQPGSDRLGNFISASMDAEKALNDGFFAPESDRPSLWGAAYRLLGVVIGDRNFQLEPNDGAWNSEHCTRAVEKVQQMRTLLERLARGDFSASPPAACQLHCAFAYFELPPKPHGEPAFQLPATTAEFSLELPHPTQRAVRRRPDVHPPSPSAGAPAPNAAQLSLF